FFFQAKDGIRDLIVTGVQTCALPISSGRFLSSPRWLRWHDGRPHQYRSGRLRLRRVSRISRHAQVRSTLGRLWTEFFWSRFEHEIGRASCRERVLIWVVVLLFE